MDSMDANGVVTFEVELDELGNYCANADVGTWSLITDGKTLDELNRRVQEVVDIYNEREERKIQSYALHIRPGRPIAA